MILLLFPRLCLLSADVLHVLQAPRILPNMNTRTECWSLPNFLFYINSLRRQRNKVPLE